MQRHKLRSLFDVPTPDQRVRLERAVRDGQELMPMDSQDDLRGAPPRAPRVDGDADASQVAQAMIAAWQEIGATLSPIIGPRGVAALYRRSLHLTIPAHPWLASAQGGIQTTVDLATLEALLVQQGSVGAAVGGGALLRTFYDLLATLIGPSLTERLLHSVWENFLSGPPTQDLSP